MIKECRVIDILNNTTENIIAEYAKESQLKDLPTCVAHFQTYCRMEFEGILKCYGAYHEDKLVGFVTVMSSFLPHYSKNVSIVESIFILKEYRRYGLGRKLLKTVERYTKERNNEGLLITAPVGGNLIDLLPKIGYKHTNSVFFKKDSDV